MTVDAVVVEVHVHQGGRHRHVGTAAAAHFRGAVGKAWRTANGGLAAVDRR